MGMEPATDQAEIHDRLALTTEMVEAIRSRLSPPSAACTTSVPTSAAPRSGAMLEAEELAETVETLRALGDLDAGWRGSATSFPGWAACARAWASSPASPPPSRAASTPGARSSTPPAAGSPCSGARSPRSRSGSRRRCGRMLRSPEIKRILRYPNFTMVGHHYVLPVAKDHRGEIQGSVQRTSATNETVYIEPTAIAEQSAQLSYLRAREAKEIRRILRWLSAQVGMVAESLLQTLDTMAELDLIHARARFSLDYRMSAPDLNAEGRLVLRRARHPLLEAIFRKDPGLRASGRLVPARRSRPMPRGPRRERREPAEAPRASARPRSRPRPSPEPSCRSTSTSASSSRSWS